MAAKLEALVNRWLHSLKIPVSSYYLNDKLHFHPDYPSLASITCTLDELGIDNAALIVDKEKLEEVPVPFLVHSPVNGSGFVTYSFSFFFNPILISINSHFFISVKLPNVNFSKNTKTF